MEEPHLISNATMQQGLGRYILEWEWAVCTFLVSNSQSTKRCRSQNFASLSLVIPLQCRQGRPNSHTSATKPSPPHHHHQERPSIHP